MESGCNENNLFKKLVDQSILDFDYEVNSVQFVSPQEEKQIFFLDKVRDGKNFGNKSSNLGDLSYDSFWDTLLVQADDCPGINIKKKKANFLKRLVSKKKNRFQDENFDLDLA
jgi:hypothetical protein